MVFYFDEFLTHESSLLNYVKNMMGKMRNNKMGMQWLPLLNDSNYKHECVWCNIEWILNKFCDIIYVWMMMIVIWRKFIEFINIHCFSLFLSHSLSLSSISSIFKFPYVFAHKQGAHINENHQFHWMGIIVIEFTNEKTTTTH